VTWRIDDVDQDVLVTDSRVLRKDGDAAFALELVAVHGPLGDAFVGAKDAGLLEHRVDESGLAMIDVGDDGDVAEIGRSHGVNEPLERESSALYHAARRTAIAIPIAGLQPYSRPDK
jgi:hypothetical protein